MLGALSRLFSTLTCWHVPSTLSATQLLLYGGAIHEAGEVRARRGSKSATSDWMEMEKQRGARPTFPPFLTSQPNVSLAFLPPLLTALTPPPPPGISISSTAVSFDYKGFTLNLLDTPGHADFSEDTYRTLSASDNAVMLIDAGKGALCLLRLSVY